MRKIVALSLLLALLSSCGILPSAGPGGGPTDTSVADSLLAVQPDVVNRAFYKDIFLDGGIGLTSRDSLFAATAAGFSLDAMNFSRAGDQPEEFDFQNALIAGDENDENGRLLYPDGQPRYKVLFVNGGSSRTHGKSLSAEARARMKEFVAAGGSYVGCCAGAFFACRGYDKYPDYAYYLALWPGVMQHTGISNEYTDFAIEPDSPLLQYSDFGGDLIVDRIRHNKGGYPTSLPEGTEVLARYVCPDKPEVDGQVSAWAYKVDARTGRVVQEGSHPEEVDGGEKQQLTEALIRYAMDGLGSATLKGILRKGEPRVMDKRTADADPAHTRIGDLQCHHFAFFLPDGARNVTLQTGSSVDCELQLMLCRDTYAFPDTAEYFSEGEGPDQTLELGDLQPGLWYVSVLCTTTGNFNGFPYTISLDWEQD